VDTVAEGIWLTGELLRPDECTELMALCQKNGYRQRTSPRRHNLECFVWRPAIAQQIVTRLNLKIREENFVTFCVSEMSSELQCYRYRKGDLVAPHSDAAVQVNGGKWSALTLVIYLNDKFEGGATGFPVLGIELNVPVGHGILFQQSLAHEGVKVLAGEKHIVRTDVATASSGDATF
jgi:hypothetical protein